MKRYRTPIEAEAAPNGEPRSFVWRDRTWTTKAIIGHWREDPGWWRNSSGGAVKVEQVDLWRVEAISGNGDRLICELAHRESGWVMQHIWD